MIGNIITDSWNSFINYDYYNDFNNAAADVIYNSWTGIVQPDAPSVNASNLPIPKVKAPTQEQVDSYYSDPNGLVKAISTDSTKSYNQQVQEFVNNLDTGSNSGRNNLIAIGILGLAVYLVTKR